MRVTGAMPEKSKPFANTPEFYAAPGWFYAVWSRTELTIDCAVWKAFGTETAEHAHERSAGTKFGDKCKHFRSLPAADNSAIVRPLDAPDIRRQVRLDPLPLLIAQPKQVVAHDPNPLPKTNQDRIVRAEKLMSSDPSQ
jgi:hypothetical protein